MSQRRKVHRGRLVPEEEPDPDPGPSSPIGEVLPQGVGPLDLDSDNQVIGQEIRRNPDTDEVEVFNQRADGTLEYVGLARANGPTPGIPLPAENVNGDSAPVLPDVNGVAPTPAPVPTTDVDVVGLQGISDDHATVGSHPNVERREPNPAVLTADTGWCLGIAQSALGYYVSSDSNTSPQRAENALSQIALMLPPVLPSAGLAEYSRALAIAEYDLRIYATTAIVDEREPARNALAQIAERMTPTWIATGPAQGIPMSRDERAEQLYRRMYGGLHHYEESNGRPRQS